MPVSKRMRYEVLRRDGYACRYCGTRGAEAALVVDHVTPRALGGKDEPSNLVTACEPCNTGKSSTVPGLDLVNDTLERHGLHETATVLWTRVSERALRDRDLALPECHCLDYCGDPQCRLVFAAYMSGWLDHMDIVDLEVDGGSPMGSS